MDTKYGHQCDTDVSFTRRARLLQSLYRLEINESEGKGPNKNSKNYYGNMISNGEISGKNFFLKETFQYAKERVENKKKEETIDEFRLFNNLLSSMPMAFNLFHPLMLMLHEHPDLTTSVFRAALPDMSIGQVTKIGIEYIPVPIEDYTNDKSAMDAYIQFKDRQGRPCILAVETKYTDVLGTNEAKGIEKQKALFSTLGIFTDNFLEGIRQGRIKISQIYRNILLTERYRIKNKLSDSYSIVLSPEAHPTTQKEIDTVSRYLLKDKLYKLKAVALEDFIEKLIDNSPEFYKDVFVRFRKRYLDFEKADGILTRDK